MTYVLLDDLLRVCQYLEKWFPLQGERAHSLYFCMQDNSKEVEERETEQHQTYQLTQADNIFTNYKYTIKP